MSWGSLGFKSYQEYLNHWTWKEKRDYLIYLKEKCKCCGSKRNLIVHHKNYDSVGNENMHDVEVLCKNCHEKVHKIMENLLQKNEKRY